MSRNYVEIHQQNYSEYHDLMITQILGSGIIKSAVINAKIWRHYCQVSVQISKRPGHMES